MGEKFIGIDGKLREKSILGVNEKGELKERLLEGIKENHVFKYLSTRFKKNISSENDIEGVVKGMCEIWNSKFYIPELKKNFYYENRENRTNIDFDFEEETKKTYNYFVKILKDKEQIKDYWNYLQTLK